MVASLPHPWDSQQPLTLQTVVKLPAGSKLILGGVVVEAVGSPREGSPSAFENDSPHAATLATSLPYQEQLQPSNAGIPFISLTPMNEFPVEQTEFAQALDSLPQKSQKLGEIDLSTGEDASPRSNFAAAPANSGIEQPQEREAMEFEGENIDLGRLPTFARLATADVDLLLEDLVRFPSLLAEVPCQSESAAREFSGNVSAPNAGPAIGNGVDCSAADGKIKENPCTGRCGSLELFNFETKGVDNPQDAFNLN